ncbi:MAG TPA: SPOR domain-containing protein [Bacteroidia bacterium]
MIKRILFAIFCVTFSLAFSQEVSITNELPTSGTAGQAIEAKFNLTKAANMGSFAKFQLDLPAGFDAQSTDIKGGNFTFENNRIKIVWVSLPADASFDFIFKITPSASASGNVRIAPQFFYLENNVKKEYNVPPATIDFGGGGAVSSDNTNNTSNNTTSDNTNNTTTNNSNNNTSNTDNNSNTNSNNSKSNTNNTNSGNNSNTNNTNSNTSNNNTSTNTNNTTSNTSNATNRNVAYHVQLAALTNKPNKSKFAHYGAIKIVEDAGLYKVLVGKFATLAEARAYKKTLIAKGAEGVFVVAYENGVRVKIN